MCVFAERMKQSTFMWSRSDVILCQLVELICPEQVYPTVADVTDVKVSLLQVE